MKKAERKPNIKQFHQFITMTMTVMHMQFLKGGLYHVAYFQQIYNDSLRIWLVNQTWMNSSCVDQLRILMTTKDINLGSSWQLFICLCLHTVDLLLTQLINSNKIQKIINRCVEQMLVVETKLQAPTSCEYCSLKENTILLPLTNPPQRQ